MACTVGQAAAKYLGGLCCFLKPYPFSHLEAMLSILQFLSKSFIMMVISVSRGRKDLMILNVSGLHAWLLAGSAGISDFEPVLQLKRFEYSTLGFKINKKVEYEAVLNLAPYMSERRLQPVIYDLYGVLVHSGHSVHSGHYFCFVRAANGIWYMMDDSQVRQVGVLKQFLGLRMVLLLT